MVSDSSKSKPSSSATSDGALQLMYNLLFQTWHIFFCRTSPTSGKVKQTNLMGWSLFSSINYMLHKVRWSDSCVWVCKQCPMYVRYLVYPGYFLFCKWSGISGPFSVFRMVWFIRAIFCIENGLVYQGYSLFCAWSGLSGLFSILLVV